jgi:hypothetical protein
MHAEAAAGISENRRMNMPAWRRCANETNASAREA